jgi:DNA polymerase-4
VLHVDCDCFFAAVEMRDQPQYRDVPIAIGGASDRRGVISTCNYLARKFGVRSAMSSAQALSLCPQLKLLPGNMAKYKQVSNDVMEILRTYGLDFEQVSVDEAYLELPESSNAILVAEQIRQQVEAEIGITVSVGIAPNKFLAKVASDWNKPNGQFAILPNEVDEFVSNLDVRKIPGVGPKSAEKLANLGITKCAHIKDMPQDWLLQRFGKFGKLLSDRAHGIDSRSVKAHRIRKSISIERTFAEDIQREDEIKEALQNMWPKFLERVSNAGLTLDGLAPFVKVKYADFQVTTLADHECKAKLDDYEKLLYRAAHRQGKAIRLLGIGGRLKNQESAQLSLFN